jgi:hypothetical protein
MSSQVVLVGGALTGIGSLVSAVACAVPGAKRAALHSPAQSSKEQP